MRPLSPLFRGDEVNKRVVGQMSIRSVSTATLVSMYLLAEEPLLTHPVSVLQPGLVEDDLVKEERVRYTLLTLLQQKGKFWKFRTADCPGVVRV